MAPVTIDRGRLAAISHLDEGRHDQAENAMCVMEAAAWVAHEPWSDHPACVCPVIAAYARALNDRMPDGQRQRLIPLIPAMIGTAGDGHDVWRMYRCADWAVRVAAPRALDAAGLDEHAERLRALAPVADQETAAEAAKAARVAEAAAEAAVAWAAEAAEDAAWAARAATRVAWAAEAWAAEAWAAEDAAWAAAAWATAAAWDDAIALLAELCAGPGEVA